MKNKTIALSLVSFALLTSSIYSCKKEGKTSSVYGKYITPTKCTDCAWWEVPGSRTIIEVSPLQTGYIKIVTAPGWLNEMVFDSALLSSVQSFTVNQIVQDRYAIGGTSYATGTGNLKDNKIALNFTINRRFPASVDSMVIKGAEKIQ